MLVLIFIALIIWVGFVIAKKYGPTSLPVTVSSFEECAKAGYPVMESYPRQCKTPDGRTFAEEVLPKISYTNASGDEIKVDLPFPGAVTGKTFSLTGQARGWFFEGVFPVQVLDMNGKILASASAQATGDWATSSFVAFKSNITVPDTYIGKAILVLSKDNPSGLPQNDASISFPITIEY